MAVFRLPRLPVNWKEQPLLFERYWDQVLTQLEKTLNSILQIPVIQAALAEVQAAAATAQATAEAAQAAATGAGEGTVVVATETSLVNSYTTGYSGALITATSTGLVTIQTHTRVYGDSVLNPSVSVTGDTLSTGAAADDVVRVFYDDSTRSGGAVSYYYVIDPADSPAQSGDVHSVGAVMIPALGSADGKGLTPRGHIEL